MAGLLSLYDTLIRAGAPLLGVLLRRRVKLGKEDPLRLSERMGQASRPRPGGPLVWLHAASVGESQSALILLDALRERAPGLTVLVTTGTLTSAQLMARRLPSFAFHQYVPLDHPDWVARFLDHWRPDLALWMESELWPNTLLALHRRGIPAALVSARLSEKSFAGWKRAPGAARQVLSCFDLILAQTDHDALRFRTLGAKNTVVGDNIKYSAAPLPVDQVARSALKLTIGDRKIWLFASTHAGEESLGCRMHKRLRDVFPDILTIIVPRHPERREDIARICFEYGLKYRLRGDNYALPAPDDDIYIADTLGELGLFYSLSPIAVIGRSFSDDGGGGHNPVEAAQLGCAILTGPNNQFQRQIYDDMAAAGAVLELRGEDDLFAAIQECLVNPDSLTRLRERSAEFVTQKSRVIDGVMAQLSPLLERMEKRNAA